MTDSHNCLPEQDLYSSKYVPESLVFQTFGQPTSAPSPVPSATPSASPTPSPTPVPPPRPVPLRRLLPCLVAVLVLAVVYFAAKHWTRRGWVEETGEEPYEDLESGNLVVYRPDAGNGV
jgi:hypothetical protein